MSKRIVKDGKFCISNGRFVTDADGAPCACGGGGNPDDYPCDGPSPTCFIVTLTGFNKSACEGLGCMYVPGEAVGFFPVDSVESVSGIDGTYFVGEGEYGVTSDCLVKGKWTNSEGEEFVGIITERFGIDFGTRCDSFPDGVPYGSVHAANARVTLQQGGAGCGAGVIFLQYDDVPLGASIASGLSSDCEDRPHHVTGGTVTISGTEGCDGENLTTYFAELCEDPTQVITVDIENRPANHRYCVRNGHVWALTTDRSEDAPISVSWQLDPCTVTQYAIATACDDSASPIVFDPALRPPNGVTMTYQGVRYIPTTQTTQDSPVSVTWSPDACPEPTNARYAELCTDRTQRITYDRAIAQTVPGVRTCIYQNKRWHLTAVESLDPPVTVSFSTSACFGFQNPCNDIPPGGDDRCDNPVYRHCPQCDGYTPSDDPVVGPHRQPGRSSEELPDEPGFGDAVASAIEFVTRGVFEGCSGCARRKAILNKFGNRLGWKVIRFKGW